ncbi:MAG: enoyl-CoA hydratase-related protein [Mesorhizobium sp.]|nr:enoyl-CoA hydratase-related protein [Mesorhizobium sp.]MCO5164128.1 enoyl-CoA hydratase-related protein [Mesorhizobium sp.]
MQSPVTVQFEIRQAVAFVTLDRPEVLNGIDVPLARALGQAIDQALDGAARCIVLRGAGRAFCAGGDVSRFDGSVPFATVADRTMSTFHPVILKLANVGLPTVAAVHGAVAGAGLGLMLACDFAIAASGTRFTPAYPKIGATIDAGMSWFLARALGTRKARVLAMLADTFDAEAAMQMGLVNRVVPAEALAVEAEAFGQRLASGPTAAYATIKRLVDVAHDSNLAAQLDAEQAGFVDIAKSADFAEGLAAFMAKRPPSFSGK